MTKKNQTAKRALCAVLALAMLIGGTFAYFSDYASTQVKGTAGTVAVAMDSDINLLDAEGRDILNPGDMRDGSFSVTNEGNKSIDVRTTIAVTAVDHAGNAIDFTGSATEQSEYDLYAAEDVIFVEGEGYMPKEGAQPLQVKSIDGNTITYVLPEYSLNGNSDKYAEVETIDGVDAFSKDNEFVFLFKGASENKWQASGVSIDVLVEAKQHENTGAGWDIVAQENVSIGAINQSAVKGENVITDGANASSAIPVISKNENGEDLNASASLITGAKADELLDALEEAGLTQKEDVDILIDVESDDFEGMADTTFDVSDLAEDGDTAVIMHYDETKGEWEYIATETVTDGKVSGDFSSYSPVAIQIIKKEEGEGTDSPELNPDEEATPHMLVNGYSFATKMGDATSVDFLTTDEAAQENLDGIETVDLSDAGDGSILGARIDSRFIVYAPDGGAIQANPDSSEMFYSSDLEEIDVANLDVSNVETMYAMFTDAAVTELDLSSWDVSNVTDMSEMFVGCYNLTNLNIDGWDTSSVENMNNMFAGGMGYTELDLSDLDVSNVITMNGMFQNCENLVSLDLSGWNALNAVEMNEMFYCSTSLETIDLSDWNMPKVESMMCMFSDCSALTTVKLTNWDTSSVVDMSGMFAGCTSLETLDLSHFDVSNVTTMNCMFNGCEALKTLNIDGWDTTNVTDMGTMFSGCGLPELDLSHFNVANVEDMSQMFAYCPELTTLDLSTWTPNADVSVGWMFENSDALTTIYAGDWTSIGIYDPDNMFKGCDSLVGAVAYDGFGNGLDYANPTTGYFTAK